MATNSDQTLLLEVLIGLPVVHVALIILEFFHRLLLKDFMPAFLFQLFGNCE